MRMFSFIPDEVHMECNNGGSWMTYKDVLDEIEQDLRPCVACELNMECEDDCDEVIGWKEKQEQIKNENNSR